MWNAKEKKSSVFETIKLQKVRYISNIVLTHLFCTQDTTYCNQFCWWWVFCLLLDFFTFLSVHVRERERERPLAYDPFSEGELWTTKVWLRCWKIKHYTKINFCCQVHLVSNLFSKRVPKWYFGSLKWLYRHFLNQHRRVSDVTDDANKGNFRVNVCYWCNW